MYVYDEVDRQLLRERVAQFRGQVQRRLAGDLTEEEFKPLRLQNGLYMQLHAYMLRIAIPYGLLSSRQLRKLADITRRFDRGYGHFTTRQNLQLNWIKLEDVPEILAELASVEMHANQTSGNCVRNVTADHLGGVSPDEIEDPRPWAELLRQWSTFHPEFLFLPRKFKIAVTGSPSNDRAAVRFHDIGLRIVPGPDGRNGFEVLVGGGMGRTPVIGKVIREFVPREHLLSYVESVLRVYNQLGRRDNIHKARIKILVNTLGIDRFREMVEADWATTRDGPLQLRDDDIERYRAYFQGPALGELPDASAALAALRGHTDPALALWARNNVQPHRRAGYVAVILTAKGRGVPPGDLSDTEMERVADLADRYSHGELRVTHTQNLVFADVRASELESLYADLRAIDLVTPNAGRLTDQIACPGLDFCNLANARSIPVALKIRERFDDLDFLEDLGEVSLKISGCINACGHHHVGHIGILGVNHHGAEGYQLMLGGSASDDASIGRVIGPSFGPDEIVDALDTVLRLYLELRESPEERFLDAYRRLGPDPFRRALYHGERPVQEEDDADHLSA